MSRNNNVSKIIDYVKKKIERCIQKYMSLEETMTYLYENHQIKFLITRAIWEHLEKDNPNFFKEFYKRCKVACQIAKFNDLLAQHGDLMQKFREIEFSYVAPVTQFQKPNDQLNHHHQQDQIYDQWIASNDFAYIENSIYSLIDPSSVAAPPQTDLSASNITNGIDFEDMSLEQFVRDLDQQQQRIWQLKSQKPQHLTDQQVAYFPWEHDHTRSLIQQVQPQYLDWRWIHQQQWLKPKTTTENEATNEIRKKQSVV